MNETNNINEDRPLDPEKATGPGDPLSDAIVEKISHATGLRADSERQTESSSGNTLIPADTNA